MLSIANTRLANAGNYSMRVTKDVVRNLAVAIMYVKLDAWMYYTFERRARANRLRHTQKVLQRSAMKAIAGSWHGWSVEQRVTRAVIKRAVARLGFKSLDRSFRGWVQHYVTQGRRAVVVQAARRKILMARVVGAYAAWTGLSRQERVRKFKVACSLRTIHRHLKRHVFCEWSQVAHTEVLDRKAIAEGEAAKSAVEIEAARVAAQAAAEEEARATRIIAEVRARAQARALRAALTAFEQNNYVAPRKRFKFARGLKLHRNGLLQWAWAWMSQYATRQARRTDRLNCAQSLIRHSTLRRCFRRFETLAARLRAEDAAQKEKAAHDASLEASEAEVMRLGIDNRRLQRKMRIIEEEATATAAEGGDIEADSGAAVPRLKIPGSTPRSARSDVATPRSHRSNVATPRSTRSSARSVRSSRSDREPVQQNPKAAGLEAELNRLNRKVDRLAERESHILSMLTEHCTAEDGDGRLLVTPRGNNLETKAAAAVSRGAETAAAMEEGQYSRRSDQAGSGPTRQVTPAMLPAGFAPWTGRDAHNQKKSAVFFASSSRTQQLVRYPASFNELVRVLHKKPLRGSSGVGLQVEEMAYSSLYIHTHIATEPEAANSDLSTSPTRTTTTTHIYAEDASRTHSSLDAGMETVAPPARSKRRRSRTGGRRRRTGMTTSVGSYEATASKHDAAATTKLSELHPRGISRLEAAMAKVRIAAA
jgi:hypothetical protein